MKHTITIRSEKDEGMIMLATIIGDGDENVAKEFVNTANKLLDKYQNKKVCGIVDMLLSGTSDYKGIKIYQEFLKDKRLGPTAFVIKNPVVKAFVKIATEFKPDVEFFESIESAEEWLNEKC